MCEVNFRLDNWFLPHDSSYTIIRSGYQLGNLSVNLPIDQSPADLFINQADCMSISINRSSLVIEILLAFLLIAFISVGTINEYLSLPVKLPLIDWLNFVNPFSTVLNSIQIWRKKQSSESINQSVNQSVGQSVNLSINQLNNQSINQLNNETTNPSNDPLINQPVTPRQMFLQSPLSLIYCYAFFQLLLSFGTLINHWSLVDHQSINLLSLLFLTLFGQLSFMNLSIKYVWSLQSMVGVPLIHQSINQSIVGCHIFIFFVFFMQFLMNILSFIFTTSSTNQLTNQSINHLKFIHASILFSMFSFSILKLVSCLIVGNARQSINQSAIEEILADESDRLIDSSNNQSINQSINQSNERKSMHAEYRAYADHARNVFIVCLIGCLIDCLIGAFVLSTSPRYYLMHVFFINQLINQSFMIYSVYHSDPLPSYFSQYVQRRSINQSIIDRMSLRSIPEIEEDYDNMR